jgi:Fe2+ or Zn2+ uptake regulation protein
MFAREVGDLLREHGIPVTAQRISVLQAIGARPHATADAIAEDVRAGIGAISRQAVYDALGMLVQKGLVRRIQPAGSPSRYETRAGDNHHHLICRACGMTTDVDCAIGAAPCLSASASHGYRIDEAEVVFWGTCPACQAASGS